MPGFQILSGKGQLRMRKIPDVCLCGTRSGLLRTLLLLRLVHAVPRFAPVRGRLRKSSDAIWLFCSNDMLI
jgi:hypothetical protein